MIRLVHRLYWLAKSLVTGRTYYADGTSERSSRAWVWATLRPYPALWLSRRAPWLTLRPDCGCVRWKVTQRPVLWCMEHGVGSDLFTLADAYDAERARAAGVWDD